MYLAIRFTSLRINLSCHFGFPRNDISSTLEGPDVFLDKGAGVAQLVSAWPSELQVPGSIFGDSIVCFDFLLICVALALNTRKTEH